MTPASGTASARGRPSPAATAAENTAAGAQVGFVHANVTDYLPASKSPAEKYRLAVRFLKAGIGRRAAELFAEAVTAGFSGDQGTSANEVAYNWALAILSGRTYQQLMPADLADLQSAERLTNRTRPDAWLSAHDIIRDLVDAQRQLDEGTNPDLTQLRVDYANLSPLFQDGFQRHLEVMLVAGIEELAEAQVAGRAREQRMSDNRKGRAWKYFEQEPEPPLQRRVLPPVLPFGNRLAVAVGAVLALAGMVLEIWLLERTSAVRAVVVAGVAVLGGIMAARCRISYVAAAERLADREREFGHHHASRYSSPLPVAPSAGLPDDIEDDDAAENARLARNRRRRFERIATSHLDGQFSARGPRAPAARNRWSHDTAALRRSLLNEILRDYSAPNLAPASVNWLISWRVKQIREMWQAGALHDFRVTMAPRQRDWAGTVVGVLAVGAALAYGVIRTGPARPAAAVVVVLSLAAGGIVLALSQVDVYLVHRTRLTADRQEAADRYAAERAEYERWRAELADMPRDDEIARWLDFDKIFVRNLMMHQLGLTSQDILAHATLTEPAAGCLLVRAPNGPPRYTAYSVTVFLLTHAGVRQIVTGLDFRTGQIHGQSRRSFRYEVITTAAVNETGVRYDTGTREAAQRRAGILRQDVVLSLGDRDHIRFRAENLGEFAGDVAGEDPIGLLDVALEASGITAAVDLLEDISGNGAQWVEARLHRRRGAPAGGS